MSWYKELRSSFSNKSSSSSRNSRGRLLSKQYSRRRLQYEQLESRDMLAADLNSLSNLSVESNHTTSSGLSWFESFHDVQRIPLGSLANVNPSLPEGMAGPMAPAVGEWIVQLSDSVSKSLKSLSQANPILNVGNSSFSIISGLGMEGLLLVRGEGTSKASIESSLSSNDKVKSFSLNQLIQGQATTTNDPEFIGGLLTGLSNVDAANAWDVSRGSTSTVVGVIDTGIDSTHPDLYLNIWINQGELPPSYLDNVGPKLTDIDNDGLITFYDLNNVTRATTAPYAITVGGFSTGPNASFVVDRNNNGRIDAQDLLADPNWADGFDDDNNGFFDDFFGVNFRSGASDRFAPNDPSDELGHGTHVAGTIGAIGSNGVGVVGVNWQTSLMSLRILDNNNQGDSGAAIRAVNYAREMRERYRVDPSGRVIEGANVRVLNNSWGQPLGYEVSLEAAIKDSSEAGILFVAAAGNGNILGQGVDNDLTPFYPASYDVPGVIAVAAANADGTLASFSNFGKTSVDILAPGVGIRSTLAGGGYGSANGTSMATPHVSGTAALIWSAFPEATVEEVEKAIRTGVTPVSGASAIVSTAGKLNSSNSIRADVFAPSAKVLSNSPIVLGGTSTEITVRYSHASGINAATVGDDDLLITRTWGPVTRFTASLKTKPSQSNSKTFDATYVVSAPDGTWDVNDFGDYVVSSVFGKVAANSSKLIEARDLGKFTVRIANQSVIYVDTYSDTPGRGSLRDAIIAANAAAPAPRTIILDSGSYLIDIAPVVDPAFSYALPIQQGSGVVTPGVIINNWSNATTGDFDVTGNITIVGNSKEETSIDGQQLDRLFKVKAGGSLSLSRLTLKNGSSPINQPGGAILSAGTLKLDGVVVSSNQTTGTTNQSADGGGIAVVGGTADIQRTQITNNRANASAGILFAGSASGTINQSTIDSNQAMDLSEVATHGAGIGSYSTGNVTVTNSTISSNVGIAAYSSPRFGAPLPTEPIDTPSVSKDGRYTVFTSKAKNLALNDGEDRSEVYLYDRILDTLTLVSSGLNGAAANGDSFEPDISADGNFIAFASNASNLVVNDTDRYSDVFVYNRLTKAIEIISVDSTGTKVMSGDSRRPSISGDGRYVAFDSNASGLTLDDENFVQISNYVPILIGTDDHIVGIQDIYRKDRLTGRINLVSVDSTNKAYQIVDIVYNRYDLLVGSISPSISDDGNTIIFESEFGDLTSVATTTNRTLYARNLTNGSSRALSIPTDATKPRISGNGSIVIYERIDAGINQIYSYRLPDNANTLVSKASDNTAFAFSSSQASVNFDGTLVSFRSSIKSLTPSSVIDSSSVYIKNLANGAIRSVSAAAADAAVGGNNSLPTLSGDGLTLAFLARSQKTLNVANGDNTFYTDLFVYDLTANTAESATSIASGELKLINVTFAFNDSVVGATGRIVAGNSLFVGTTGKSESITKFGRSLGHNLYDTTAPGPFKTALTDKLDTTLKTKLSSFTIFPGFTPGYALSIGNSAINGADPLLSPSVDQRNATRDSPDIGALEASAGTIAGTLFVDSDGDKTFDRDETGLADATVYIDLNSNGNLDAGEPTTITAEDVSSTLSNETGLYSFVGIAPGSYSLGVITPIGYSARNYDARTIRTTGSSDTNVSRPSISADGKIVAFEGYTDPRFPGDTVGQVDIYIDDAGLDILSRTTDGDGTAPSLSDSGNQLVYVGNSGMITYLDRTTGDRKDVGIGSEAIISGDGLRVVYIRDFQSVISLYSVATGVSTDIIFSDSVPNLYGFQDLSVEDSIQARSKVYNVSLTKDGKFVVFHAELANGFSGKLLSPYNMYVYDIVAGRYVYDSTNNIDRSRYLAFADNSSLFYEDSVYDGSISDDGRIVTFSTRRNNFVDNDTNDTFDVFVYNLESQDIRRISVSAQKLQANSSSFRPKISGDGRYIVFESNASNLVLDDSGTSVDSFVYDLQNDSIVRIGIGRFAPTISRDGSSIAYRLNSSSVEVVPNPLAPNLKLKSIAAGELITLNLDIFPLPGQITGTLFEDVTGNAALDPEEPVFSGWTVYLDSNNDGLKSAGETSVKTDDKGSYSFAGLAGGRNYTVAAVAPSGWTTVLPSATSRFQWKDVFVPGGDTITGRDFGFRKVASTGQSSASSVSGRLYEDKNGNGVYNAGIDSPIANREVYLDATNFGVRDSNEPRVLTDANGMYTMSGLSSRTVAVSTVLDPTLIHVNPLGSSFSLQKSPLFKSIQPFGGPQSIASGDFNGDGLLDVAVALGEANKISIRLNNGRGGFLPDEIDVDLGANGIGPNSMVVGQFDNDSRLDMAVTASFSKNVIVLLNFNATTRQFTTRSNVTVGDLPIDIVAGQFAGDAKPDLVVLNKNGNALPGSVQVLTNNGSGSFTAGTAVSTGGSGAVSLAVGNFAGDTSVDVAVVHSPVSRSATNGFVKVLSGNALGGLTLQAANYPVGASPKDSAVADGVDLNQDGKPDDFNQDGRADLAVANFGSNSISILLGQANGTFRVQSTVLGTASGAFDITVGDIDNDGDMDVIASNLTDRNISIFRNIGVDPLTPTGDVRFEPLENIGLGQFPQAQRMPLVVGNFDNDRSGPGGTGTLDIVTIPTQTDTLHTLTNKLVNGSRRVALTGLNKVENQDFIIKSSILPPSFNTITSPAPIVEDSTEQTVNITGIRKGRESGPALKFTATSSNKAIVPDPNVIYVGGAVQAAIRYTPVANANGSVVITVTATDAGADGTQGTSDDASFKQSFTVSVLPVNDAPVMTVPLVTTRTQKAGAVSIPNFVTGVTRGGGSDEVSQTLSAYSITAVSSFFTVLPAISSTGTLTFTPNPNASGFTQIVVSLTDNGGTANGGSNTSARTVFIEIQPVNDAPTFNLGSNIVLEANAAAQSIAGFASGFAPGGGTDEASQTVLDYLITTTNPGLFSVLPDISNTGVLTFTPATGISGSASVSVQVRDNGGNNNGGVDLSAVKTFTIRVKSAPVVTWANPAAITFGTLLSATQLNATSSVPGTFAYTPALNTRLNAGLNQSLSVVFTPTDAVNFSSVTRTVPISVNKAVPTVTWANPANITVGTLLSATQLNATSTTPGTFVYTPALNTRLNVGANQALSVTFTPTDTVNFTSATKTATINVDKVVPVVNWATPANITVGTVLSATQLNATSTTPGTFVYTPALNTRLNGGASQTLSVTFTPTDTVNVASVTRTVRINVDKIVPPVTWSNPAAITFGTLLSATQLNATSTTPGTFVYTPAINTRLNAGVNQTLSVTFTPTDTVNIASVTRTVLLTVNKAVPAVTWANPAAITYGTLLSATQLNATSTTPGTFVYTPAINTRLNAGVNQTLSVTFTPTDAVNFSSVTRTVPISVNKAVPTVTWANPANITVGTLLSATQLNATSTTPGTFVYTPALNTRLNVGANQALSVTFTPTDTVNFTSATKTATINVDKIVPPVTWANPAAITFGTLLTTTQLNATSTTPGTFVYTPAINTKLNAGVNQTLSVTFTPTDTVNIASVTRTVLLTVNKAVPTVTWANPAAITYGTLLSATQLNATSSVPGTFAYTPALNARLNAGLNQSLSVVFTPTDAVNFSSVTRTVPISVNKAVPTVTWANPANITVGTLLSATQLNATSTTPGTFVYTPALNTRLNVGANQALSVTFTPTDTVNFTSATKTATINVDKVVPVVNWATPANITVGTVLSATQLNATSTTPGTFVYTPALNTRLNVGAKQTLSVTFTPTDTVNFTSATKTATINVDKVVPVVNWATPANITVGTVLSATQLNATSTTPGTFVYTPALNTRLNVGANQTLSVTFTPSDTVNIAPVTRTVRINVDKIVPPVTWANPAAITFGTLLTTTQLNATSTTPGTFVYTPAINTKLNAGVNQTLSVTFTPTDTVNIASVTRTVLLTVNKAVPTVTWANPAAIIFGTLLSATQLNATSTTPGTFVYTPAINTRLNAGVNQTLSVTFTPTDTVNIASVTRTVLLTVNKAVPTVTWANPAAITFGTLLSATQLNATSSVPGTFAYTPALNTRLNAGLNQSLSVVFTPADSLNYMSVTRTVQINVLKATPVVTWTNPANISFGTLLSSTQLNATSLTPGTFSYLRGVGTKLGIGNNQVLSVTFTPTDLSNFNTVTRTVNINVV